MDEDILRQLSEMAQAQMAEARANEALAAAEKERTAEFVRLRMAQERHNQFVALLTEQAAGLLAVLPEIVQAIFAIREWQDEAAVHLERLNRAAILSLSGRSDTEVLNALQKSEKKASLRRQLIQESSNLNLLREEQAGGGFDLAIENKVKKTQDKIELIKAELNALD